MKKYQMALLSSLVISSTAFGGEQIQLAAELGPNDTNVMVASSIDPASASATAVSVATPVANMVSYGFIIASGLTIVANGNDTGSTNTTVSH